MLEREADSGAPTRAPPRRTDDALDAAGVARTCAFWDCMHSRNHMSVRKPQAAGLSWGEGAPG